MNGIRRLAPAIRITTAALSIAIVTRLIATAEYDYKPATNLA